MIREMTLTGFLSFGSGANSIELRPLNLLIGPNGAGKSNLVEAFAVLRAAPRDLPAPIREGGGVREWLWRGESPASEASIELLLEQGRVSDQSALRYRLGFGAEGDAFTVLDERLADAAPTSEGAAPTLHFGYEGGRPTIKIGAHHRALRREDIDPTQSILAQRRDPESYPEITALAAELAKIRIYRDWSFGPNAPVRASCRADVQTSALSEALDNLPARLAVLRRDRRVRDRLREHLRDLSPGFDDFEVVPEGGRLLLEVREGTRNTAARRLSDGTLRYLCLLAILLDPTPPPVIVLEEPELGLHPDTLPAIRDLLVDASARTQLVVTTHSTVLVDAFSGDPEVVLVCDKIDDQSVVRRLDAAQVDAWREEGSLADLWLRGHLGGTRW